MPTKTKAKARKSSTKSQPTVSIVFSTFDSSYDPSKPFYREIRSCPISDWVPLTGADYNPNGGTPLLDATGKFIEHLDSLKADGTVVIGVLADESGSMMGNEKAVIDGINEFVNGMKDVDDVDPDADGKVLAVIFTDGGENMSTEFSGEKIKKLITKKENEDWTFIYLGANQDSWGVGRETGFSGTSSGSTIDFAATPVGTSSALRTAGTMASSYLSSRIGYNAVATEMSGGSINEDGTVTTADKENISSIEDVVNKTKGKK